MIFIRSLIVTLLAVTFSLFGTSAFAIAIVNPGFEADAAYETAVGNPPTTGNPTGWEFYRPGAANTGQFFGTYAPDGTNFNPLVPAPSPPASLYAPQGDMISYFDLGSDCSSSACKNDVDSDGDYPVGLQQTLSATLEKNSFYTLSVAVGNPKSGGGYDYTGFGGYRIELLAGDTVIGQDNNSKSIAEGVFVTSLFSVSSADVVDDSLFGKALGIRLIHKGRQEEPAIVTAPWYSGIAFDDVQLNVSAVPVPAAVWLFGTALAGLVGFGKRRKLT